MNGYEKIKYATIVLLFICCLTVAPYEVLVVGLLAFSSMILGGIMTGLFTGSTSVKVVGHGVGSGMMLASVFVILAPKAFNASPVLAGIGVSVGYAVGYASHELAHIVSHDISLLNRLKQAELTVHSAIAGLIIGVTYSSIPELSVVFGVGIVAHKLPAGFTTVVADEQRIQSLILPASAVGIVAVPSYLLLPAIPVGVQSVLTGVSTGVFLHIAVDMIPECVSSSERIGHGVIECSSEVDKQRVYASISVLVGILLISALSFIA